MKDNKWLNKDEWDFHKEYMNKLITKEKVIVNTDLAKEHIKSKEEHFYYMKKIDIRFPFVNRGKKKLTDFLSMDREIKDKKVFNMNKENNFMNNLEIIETRVGGNDLSKKIVISFYIPANVDVPKSGINHIKKVGIIPTTKGNPDYSCMNADLIKYNVNHLIDVMFKNKYLPEDRMNIINNCVDSFLKNV